MTVRVMLRRRVARAKEAEVYPLIVKMRSLATIQPGYISGETLVNADDREEVLVISTWNDLDSWRDWLISKERSEINEKIEPLLQEPTEVNAYFYGDEFLYK